MKNYLGLCIVMTLYAVMFCGCHSKITGTSSFYGSVNVIPTTAKNGDLITLKISPAKISGTGTAVSIGTNSTINGKNVVKSIEYYIDGEKIAESSDYENNYTITYLYEFSN